MFHPLRQSAFIINLGNDGLTCFDGIRQDVVGLRVDHYSKLPEVDTDLLSNWAGSGWDEGHLHNSPAVALDSALP